MAVETYKILQMSGDGYTVKNPFYVMQAGYIYKDGTPQYRLVKQCSTLEKAREYIKACSAKA